MIEGSYDGGPLLPAGPSVRGWSHQGPILCPFRYAAVRLWGRAASQDPTPPLIKGALVHQGLSHLWARRLDGDTYRGLLDPVDAVHAEAARCDRLRAVEGYDPIWRPLADVAATAVHRYVQADPHVHLTPLAVEREYWLWCAGGRLVEAPDDADDRLALWRDGSPEALRTAYLLGAPWLTSWRVDLLAATAAGQSVVVDWKTMYRCDSRKRAGFKFSGQFHQYDLWGRLAYGTRWGGAYVGGINLRETASSRSTAARMFPSWRVDVTPGQARRFPMAVCDRAETIRRLLLSGRDLADWPRATVEQGPCSDRYADCDARQLCAEV